MLISPTTGMGIDTVGSYEYDNNGVEYRNMGIQLNEAELVMEHLFKTYPKLFRCLCRAPILIRINVHFPL